jgi:hypothetical protein
MNVPEKSKKIAVEASRVYIVASWLFLFIGHIAPEVYNGARLRFFFQMSTYILTAAFFCLPNPPVPISKGELLTKCLAGSVDLITGGAIVILLGYSSGDWFAVPLGLFLLVLGARSISASERIRDEIRRTDSID